MLRTRVDTGGSGHRWKQTGCRPRDTLETLRGSRHGQSRGGVGGSRAWGHRSHQTWPLRENSRETKVGDPVPGPRVRGGSGRLPQRGSPAVYLPGPAVLQHGHTLLTVRRWLKDTQWGQKSGGGRGPTLCPPVPVMRPWSGGPLQPLTCPQHCLRPLRCPPLIVPKVGLALGRTHPHPALP